MAEDNYWLRSVRGGQMNRRRFIGGAAVAGVGAAALGLVGCGDDDDDASTATTAPSGASPSASVATVPKRRGGILNINGTNFSKLEAVTGTGGNDHQYLWTVFDNLVGYGSDFAPDAKRSLAQTWENPDPLTWIFKLRSGVKFHDGTPFDATAVQKNFVYATDPGVASNVKSDLASIERVDVVDPLTVVYKLKTPTPGLVATLGDRAGFMSSPTAITKWGKDYGLNPVGTGPFIHEEYVKDDHTKVKRNPEYWGKDDAGGALPYLDGILWKNVAQPAAAVAALKTGELHVMWGLPGQFIKELQADSNFQVFNEPGAAGSFFYMNHTRAPFNNVNLRRAVAFAFPREPIINTVFFGAAVPALGNIGPAHWAHDPKQRRQTVDEKIVRDSLQKAGVPNGFSFEMSVSSDPSTVQEGELIQAAAKQFGIDVKLRALGTPDFYLRYIEDGFADAMNAGLSARADPTIYFKFNYHSTGTYRKTVTNENDAEIDALSQIADREAQKRAISKLQQRLNDDAYSAYIRHANTVAAVHKKVHTVVFADGKPHLGFGDVWLEA
ncbi:MAG: ABC transporter substrate-binding protein [Chloroflexota bacterium]